VTVVLYGATGYTGRLVAAELARRGLPHVLSGRDPEKLAALGAGTRAVALDDERGLRDLLDGASVVINCAGPFTRAGDALVRAAVDTRTHYVDSTGEQGFIRHVFDAHGDAAARAGVALVPALGFDYAPGDCLAHLTASGHEPLAGLTVAYAVSGFGASRGTMRSALESIAGPQVVYEDGAWGEAPVRPYRASFDFGPPLGRRAVMRYPAGEVITVPRHVRTRRLTALLTSATIAPHPVAAPLLPFTTPALALALRTPLRGLLGRAIGALPEGPAEDARRGAEFTIVAVARGEDGHERRGTLRGSDVYGLTAVALVHGAEVMSGAGYDQAGALGPAAAYDPAAFLNRLGDVGLSWELG
jgi:short subunit dehydrogenase-like uncharacterized protein